MRFFSWICLKFFIISTGFHQSSSEICFGAGSVGRLEKLKIEYKFSFGDFFLAAYVTADTERAIVDAYV